MALRGRIGSMAMAFATLLLAVNAPVASAQSYSFSYFYDTVTFAPTGMPAPAPTVVPAPAPTAVPVVPPTAMPVVPPTSAPVPAPTAPAPTAAPVVLSVTLTVSIACADYTAEEAEVFALAMEATISGATVDADEDDCTTISRRRNLLQTSSSELGFTVTISGAAAATATITSMTGDVQASIDDGSFATTLSSVASSSGYSGTVISSVVVSGASADTMAPTPRPTAAPTPRPTAASPVIAPTATAVIESGSWRLAPGMGLLGTCIAVLATAWI